MRAMDLMNWSRFSARDDEKGSGAEETGMLTSFWRKLVEVYDETAVVLWFWLRLEHVAVFAREDIVYTVFYEFVPAADAH